MEAVSRRQKERLCEMVAMANSIRLHGEALSIEYVNVLRRSLDFEVVVVRRKRGRRGLGRSRLRVKV